MAWRLSAIAEPLYYVGPSILLLALVMFVPLVIGVSFAFQQITLLDPAANHFVGLANFAILWNDRNFWRALTNTLWWTGGSVSLQFFLGLGLALLLNRQFLGKRVAQAIVFLPWAIPTFLAGLTFAWLLNPTISPIPQWLASAGIIDRPFNILARPGVAMWGPIVAMVWWGIPFFGITLLAALQAIPGEIIEAAAIDGASPTQRFVRITLPYLAPMIAITVLLRTIWVSNFADLLFVMTGGGPAHSTETLATYIFTTAFSALDFGYASTIAVVLLLLLILYAAALLAMRRQLGAS